MCRQKAERERRLRSKRCVYPCGPPRWIVTLEPLLSMPLWSRYSSPTRAHVHVYTHAHARNRDRTATTAPPAVAPYPALWACTARATLITVPRIMRVSLAKAASILGATAMIAVCSCEKHPVGQMPEVQREQADPAKVWSQRKSHPEEPSRSRKPAEAHDAR